MAGNGLPSLTNVSTGEKITLWSAINASNVNYAFGTYPLSGRLWYSVPQATSSFVHAFYGGTTELFRIQGDGQIQLTAGTVSLPSISAGLNSTDTNTGIYFPAADTIGFVEGGAEAMRIDSNGRINLLAGSAANPILNAGLNSSDTNTGIYFPAADSIGLSVGGATAGVINTTGYGIQTASPSAWIHLSSTPSASKWIRFDASRNAAAPPETNAGAPDTGIGTNGAVNKYLQEPDVWMEVILDSAGKGGAVVLIPCYLPG